MKKSLLWIVVLLLSIAMVAVFSLAGCKAKAAVVEEVVEEEAPAEEEAVEEVVAEEVTLSIWWAEQDQFKAPLLEAIMQFEDANPTIKIEPEWTPNFDYYEQYKIALAGGEAPDVVKIDHVFVQELGYSGQIYDLTEFGANGIKDLFIQSTWEANMYQEFVYALPFDANTLALMYNKDILDRVGAEPPTTLEELIEVSTKINALGEEGIYGFTIPFGPGGSGFIAYQFVGWLARNGATILNDDWTEGTLDTPEAINALKQMRSLLDTGAAPENVFLENEFYSGSVGMLEMGPWHVPTITSDTAPANFGIVPLVSLNPDIETYGPLGLYSLAIAKDSEHPSEAYKFIAFLATSDAFNLAFSKATNLMPSLKSTYADEFYDNDVWQVFITQLERTASRPGSPAWPSINEAITEAIQFVLLGEKTPEQSMKDANAAINEALGKL